MSRLSPAVLDGSGKDWRFGDLVLVFLWSGLGIGTGLGLEGPSVTSKISSRFGGDEEVVSSAGERGIMTMAFADLIGSSWCI